MTETRWFRPTQVFDGDRLRDGLAVGVTGGTVTHLAPMPGATPLPGVLTPGFLDLQVNGGGDVLFNQTPSADGIRAIAAAHRRFGTVGILPTLITDAPGLIDKAAEAVLSVWGDPGVLGIHIEGPHLSLARRGTHAAKYIRPVEPATLAAVRRLRAAGVPVMITVAPENASPQDIAALAGMGAVVSIGHSDGSAEETRAALAAGASCFTHLFNAMSPMLNRSPGVTGAAINSTAHAGIICDGIHVADEMVGLAIRARPEPDRTFLVSDAMPTVGGSGRFRLYDMDLHLEGGRLVNAEGSLAGAHVTMAESVQRLVSAVGIPLETALRMAVTIPARVIGRAERATLIGRPVDEVVCLNPDLGFAGVLSDRDLPRLTA